MKKLVFVGDSRKRLKEFPTSIRQNAGRNLVVVQEGAAPPDLKSLTGIGQGVQELRLWGESGTFRVVFVASFPEAVYVLHAFQKKTQATTARDVDLIRKRYEEVNKMRRGQ